MENQLKFCPHCKKEKPFTSFSKDNSRPIRLQSWCKNCRAPRLAEWNKTNGRNHNLIQKYGITLEEKKKILEKQDSMCANLQCRKPLVLVGTQEDKAAKRIAELDHDHSTDKVRGILCKGCNVALGAVHDKRGILLGLFSYLYAWQTKDSNE